MISAIPPKLRSRPPKVTDILQGYTHDAPDVALAGPDFRHLAEQLVGKHGNVDRAIDRLYAEALGSAGDFSLPMEVSETTKRSMPVIGGHPWGNESRYRRGPVPSEVMVVGKMLGEQELQHFRQFCGPSGQLLLEVLTDYGAKGVARWYVTNLLKCQPPLANLSTLRSVWLKDFLPLLQLELRIVRPKYLLLLGADALKAVLGRNATLRGVEGQAIPYKYRVDKGDGGPEEWHETLVVACLHPAHVLSSPQAEPQFRFNVIRFAQLAAGERWDQAELGIEHIEIDSDDAFESLIDEIEGCPEAYGPPSRAGKPQLVLGLDSEWHGEHPQNKGSYMRMMQVSWKDKTAAVIHLTHPGGKWRFRGGPDRFVELAQRLLKNNEERDVRLVGSFLVSDLEWFLHMGIDLRAEFDAPVNTWDTRTEGGFDIAYAAHAVEETSPLDLTSLTLRYTTAPRYDVALDHWKESYCKEHGLKAGELGGFGMCPDEILAAYANYDADIVRRIFWKLQDLLDKDRFGNCCREAFWMTQRVALPILEMNTTGFLVDRTRIDVLTASYMRALAALDDKIRTWARWPELNLNSHYHTRELLYGEALNGKKCKPGETTYRQRPVGEHADGQWIAPPGRSLYLKPVLTTGKRPTPWDDAIANRVKDEPPPVPATNRQALAILAQEASEVWQRNNQGQLIKRNLSEQVLWLRDRRFLAQVLRSLLRVPKANDEGDYIEDDDGFMTYDKGLPGSICDDGRVRSYFMPTKETGRWSSVRPPVQNFAKRREEDYVRLLGEDYHYPLRTIVRATPGWWLVEADYIGAELLGAGIMSGDKQLLEDCRRNALPKSHPDFFDIHSSIAVLAFGFKCPPTQAGLESLGKLYMRIVAKCVVAGTRIQTDKGWVKVDDLAKDVPAKQGAVWEGPAIALASHGENTPLLAVYNGGRKRCVRVESEHGYTGDFARGHHFLVVQEDGSLGFRRAGKLRVGDWICIRQGEGPFGQDVEFPQIEVPRRTRYKHLELPREFDEDWAALLGLYVAEGTLVGDSFSINLGTESNPTLALEAEQLLRRIFGARLSIGDVEPRQPGYQWQRKFSVSSVLLAAWMREYVPGLQPVRGVPEFVFRWPQRLQAAFLRWLFEGDGSVCTQGDGFGIRYATSSERLARDVQLLLSGFGIVARRTSETRKGYDGTYWVLCLRTNKARQRFADLVGFVSAADRATAERRPRQYTCDHNVIPHQLLHLRRLLPFIPSPVKEKCRECLREHKRVNLSPTRLRLMLAHVQRDSLPAASRKSLAHLEELLARPISFQRIRGLADIGLQQVYDVQTTATEDHVVNYDGFLTHQSTIFGVCYGRGAKAISIQAHEEGVPLTPEEAQQVIDAINRRYSTLARFFEECRARAIEPGWICGAWGRYRRSFTPRDQKLLGDLEREFMNCPIQGLIADSMNRAVDHLYHYREEPDAVATSYRMLMQVHDALIFEVQPDELEPFVDIVLPECMCRRVSVVPCRLDGMPLARESHKLSVDVTVQRHWGEKLTEDDCRKGQIPLRFAGGH